MTDPRGAVIRQYAAAYDRHAEREQILAGQGNYKGATFAHVYALHILRAFRLETDDPEPASPDRPIPEHPHFWPIPGCPRCEGVPHG